MGKYSAKFAALALLFSVQAFACPELTGSFTCTYNDGTQEVIKLEQTTDANGLTVYNYNGSLIPADNKVYPVQEDQTLKEGTWRAWCEDNVTLKTQMTGKYYQQGAYYGDLVMNMEYSMKGTDLAQITSGTLKNTGGEYPLKGDLTCTRNP